MVSFRGRIFHPEHGYIARHVLELSLRSSIGAILSKRQWWIKWRDETIRSKWFTELEEEIVKETLEWSILGWNVSSVNDRISYNFDNYPEDGTEKEKTVFINETCARIKYHYIWLDDDAESDLDQANDDDDEDDDDEEMEDDEDDETVRTADDKYRQANEQMESYGQLVWFFDMLLFKKQVKCLPLEDWTLPEFQLGSELSIGKIMEIVQQVRRNEWDPVQFQAWCPDDPVEQHVLDSVQYHLDKVITELDAIRTCVTATLEKIITDNHLDSPNVRDFISDGPVDETWMSDTIISDELKDKFVSEVAVLENVPEDMKDWHPNSDNQVLDLVHPSLYCCVFGKTKCVPPSMFTFNTAEGPIERMQRIMFTGTEPVVQLCGGESSHQWIPSDIAVDDHGRAKILSYINNLHPVHFKNLYDSIERIFERFVPMFDRVLSCLANETGPSRQISTDEITYRDSYHLPPRPAVPSMIELQPPMTQSYTIKGRTVQVIVKIAEIVLTPENPTYPGGSWHVEGTDAEQIVATGIYYFGCDNISQSNLFFRVFVKEPSYGQDDTVGMGAMYGLERDGLLMQTLGNATAAEDRCVVFPNTLQHLVDEFELADPTKPGVRKILAFFLVDPNKTIPSSSVIPPQQTSWVKEAQQPMLRQLQQLPDAVVQQQVQGMLGQGMTLDEAKAHRLALMEERSPIAYDDVYEFSFSLCEH